MRSCGDIIFKIFPTLLDIASNSGTNGEERLMSLHCLRDAVDVHPELMVDSADEIIAKVLFNLILWFFKPMILVPQNHVNRPR